MCVISRKILVAAFLLNALTIAAEQRHVLVDVPCSHLTAAQCERFTALAKEFMPGFVSLPVEIESGRSGATCPTTDFDTLERCYVGTFRTIRQPIGSHIGLKADEAALIVLLFDPTPHVNTILGSSFVLVRGGNYMLSSFSLRASDIVDEKGVRPVYVVSGGGLADNVFHLGLRHRPRDFGRFGTSGKAWFYGDLAIDRNE